MQVKAKEYIIETSKHLYDMSKETRDSQRAMMQILIPLNATILIGILGLADTFQLDHSAMSSAFTLISCICILISLLAFIFGFGHLLIHLANSIYDMFESFIDASFAIQHQKENIELKDSNLFINPVFVIIGFVCFALGMVNIAWAFALRFHDICFCWILLTYLIVSGGIIFLLHPFFKRNVKAENVVDKIRKKYEKTI